MRSPVLCPIAITRTRRTEHIPSGMLCLLKIMDSCREVAGCVCRYFTPKEDGKFTALWFYVVPLDEHSTRVINHAVIVQPLPKLVKNLAAARPRWIDHLLLNEIFDGDMAYLAKVVAYLSTQWHMSHSSALTCMWGMPWAARALSAAQVPGNRYHTFAAQRCIVMPC